MPSASQSLGHAGEDTSFGDGSLHAPPAALCYRQRARDRKNTIASTSSPINLLLRTATNVHTSLRYALEGVHWFLLGQHLNTIVGFPSGPRKDYCVTFTCSVRLAPSVESVPVIVTVQVSLPTRA